MRRADLLFGLFWTVLGAATVFESWRMDRLEAQGINPWTVPGLVPGLLGAALTLCGAILTARAARGVMHSGNVMEVAVPDAPLPEAPLPVAPMPDGVPPDEPAQAAEPWRIALALLLCGGFAGGLVGSGLPFPLAAFAFVFLSIVAFEWPDRRAGGTLARGAVGAALIAAGASATVTLVFQELFLVRLP
ncbi:tripartite tricarboxylate transporter TctB family protein [Pararoseomonas sp. SCSIO 73927]|uniref:tripartite tricarboxylate transporter TctB family protein n=1 Tax=Pararoseomonas sp. SCSIO 73927 TaxID=3114537 RepID=UPI0030D547F5